MLGVAAVNFIASQIKVATDAVVEFSSVFNSSELNGIESGWIFCRKKGNNFIHDSLSFVRLSK